MAPLVRPARARHPALPAQWDGTLGGLLGYLAAACGFFLKPPDLPPKGLIHTII